MIISHPLEMDPMIILVNNIKSISEFGFAIFANVSVTEDEYLFLSIMLFIDEDIMYLFF
jgi:hypothetical protein